MLHFDFYPRNISLDLEESTLKYLGEEASLHNDPCAIDTGSWVEWQINKTFCPYFLGDWR